MDLLSRIEEVYLLAIWELQDNAYGVTIKKTVSKKTGKILSYGGLYFTLDQMVKKGLVTKTKGEPTNKRGGRSKNFYTLSEYGKQALKTTYEHQKSLWSEVSSVSIENI